MAKCNLCGKETELYDNGIPLCLACSDEMDRKKRQNWERLVRKSDRKREDAA